MDNVSYMQDYTLAMAKAKPKNVAMRKSFEVTAALKALRERAGLSMAEMAKQLGYKGPSSYQRYEDPALYKKDYLPVPLMRMLLVSLVGKGNPPITAEQISPLGYEDPTDKHFDLNRSLMPVLGEVQGGVWKEVDDTYVPDLSKGLPLTPLFDWGRQDQYALIVRGESMNKVARDGDYVICQDIGRVGPRTGDLVVVERTRADGSMREVTIKRLDEEFDGTPTLVPESTDPRFQQPLTYTENLDGDTTVAIKAVVLLVLSPQHASVREFFGDKR